jgi:dynein heavy chain
VFLQSLRNPGMSMRHWDQLTADLGRDMHFDSSFTLDTALKQGLLAHLDQISKVSDVASKEYSIEQVRIQLPSTW